MRLFDKVGYGSDNSWSIYYSISFPEEWPTQSENRWNKNNIRDKIAWFTAVPVWQYVANIKERIVSELGGAETRHPGNWEERNPWLQEQ